MTNDRPKGRPPSGKQFVYSMAEQICRQGGDGYLSLARRLVVADTWARFLRQRQVQTIAASGVDGFAESVLPVAEREAVPVEEYVRRETVSIEKLAKQLDRLPGTASTVTHDRDYYRFTQWIFLRLFAKQLVEQTPSRPIGEEASPQPQPPDLTPWYLDTEIYGERLLNDIDKSQWTRSDAGGQRHMLGRLRGVELTFSASRPFETESLELTVFTTRVEAIFGATFMLLDPFHPLLDQLVDEAYVDEVNRYKQRLLKGLEPKVSAVRTGGHALNPANLQRIPILISPLANTPHSGGVVLGTPGHDRDQFDLARRMQLLIREVIHGDGSKLDGRNKLMEPWLGEGVLTNSGPFTSQPLKVGRDRIIAMLGRRGICRRVTRFRFRRQPISSSSLWGPPIPIVHCERCGPVGVPEDELPLEVEPSVLEPMANAPSESTHTHERASERARVFETTCPNCGWRARRDQQTLPPWLGRSWHFLRPLLPHLAGDVEGFRRLEKSDEALEKERIENRVTEISAASRSTEPPGTAADDVEIDGGAAEKDGTSEGDVTRTDGAAEEPARQADAADLPREDLEAPESAAPMRDGDVSTADDDSTRDAGSAPSKDAPDSPANEPASLEPSSTSRIVNRASGSETTASEDPGDSLGTTDTGGREEETTSESKSKVDEDEDEDAAVFDSVRRRPFRKPDDAPLPLPVGSVFGAADHPVSELLLARFITKFLCDLGESPVYEPFRRFRRVGDVRKVTDSSGKETSPTESRSESTGRSTGKMIEQTTEERLARWVATYGSDAVRLHLLFAGSLEGTVTASEKGVRQMHRFIERIRKQVKQRSAEGKFVSGRLLKRKHVLIHDLTIRMEKWKFHTAVSAVMGFVRFLGHPDTTIEEMNTSSLRTFVVLLSPLAPQLANELWSIVGQDSTLDEQAWPMASDELVHPPEREFPIMVNGRVRDRMQQSVELKADKLESQALQRDVIREIVGPRKINKVVVVPRRLVNIVLEKIHLEDESDTD